MTWDPDGHLASAATGGGTSTYVYDADGNRLLRRDPGSTTLYLGSAELTLNTATGELSGTRYYPTDGGPTIARTSDGRLSYIASDLNGTGTTAIDTSSLGVTRRAFKPFGEERGAQPAPGEWLGEKGFVGGSQDKATGLTHLGAREYDPKLGRFLSVDPVIDTSDPQQLQGYLYANNSPLTFSDPSGLWWGSSIVKKATQAVSKAVDVVKENYSTISNIGHTVLDVAGMIPVIGDACDIVNGVWYAAEGDWKNAAMSLVAVVPVIGSAATAARIASKVAGAVDTVTDVVRAVERGSEAAKSVRSASKSLPSSPRAVTAGGKAGPTPGAGKAGGGKASGGSGGGGKSSGGSSNAGGRAAPGCKNSFTPETLVLMADGSTKPIEQITTGDQVLAADPATGRITAEDVTATVIGDGDKNLYEITVDPATTTRTPEVTHPADDAVESAANFTVDVTKSQTVTATDNHPFWLPQAKEWRTADKLQPGQWLETSAGTWVQISSIRSYTQQQRVHNLTVSDLHTYYVLAGATPLLVHNCGGTFSNSNRTWKNSYGGDLKKQGIDATIDSDGTLEMIVRAPKDVPGLPNGTAMVLDAMKAFASVGKQTEAIRGVWNKGELGSNLTSLNKAIQGGSTPEEAVWKTFTGKFAMRNGFTEAAIDWESVAGAIGQHTEFVVTFSRPKG